MSEKFFYTKLDRFKVGHAYKIVEYFNSTISKISNNADMAIHAFYGLEHTLAVPVDMPVYFEIIGIRKDILTIKFIYPLFENLFFREKMDRTFIPFKIYSKNSWVKLMYNRFYIHVDELGIYFEEADIENEEDNDAAISISQGAF